MNEPHLTVEKSVPVWCVITNSDLTEGRGYNFILHICELEATARRFAKGAGVQGTNAVVEKHYVYHTNNGILGPVTKIIKPSVQDNENQKRIDAEYVRKQRAKELQQQLIGSGADPHVLQEFAQLLTINNVTE